MAQRIPKTSRSQYPPEPVKDTSISDVSVQNHEIIKDVEPPKGRVSKSKPKNRKSRVSRVSRISQLGGQMNRAHRVSKAEMEQKDNYFQNAIMKTRCQGCGQISETTLDHRPGCLAFTTCILLSPLGMGSCLLPFFIKSCLDMEQRCVQCQYIKRQRRATCCQ